MIVDDHELRSRGKVKRIVLMLLLLTSVGSAARFNQILGFRVTEPEPGTTVGPDTSRLRGTGTPATMIRVYSGSKELGTVKTDKDGKWYLDMPFSPGTHQIKLIALNEKEERAAEYGPFGFKVAWRENDPPKILVPGENDVLTASVPTELRGKGEPLKELELFLNDKRIGRISPDREGRWTLKVTLNGTGVRTVSVRSREKPELRHQVRITLN